MFTHQKISLAEYASKCMLLDKAAVGSKRLRMSTLGHDNKFIKPKKKTYITLTLNRVFYDIEKGLAFILAPDSMKFMNKIEPLKKVVEAVKDG